MNVRPANHMLGQCVGELRPVPRGKLQGTRPLARLPKAFREKGPRCQGEREHSIGHECKRKEKTRQGEIQMGDCTAQKPRLEGQARVRHRYRQCGCSLGLASCGSCTRSFWESERDNFMLDVQGVAFCIQGNLVNSQLRICEHYNKIHWQALKLFIRGKLVIQCQMISMQALTSRAC